MALALLLIGGCSASSEELRAQQREERKMSNEMARDQVENAKQLKAP